MKYEKYLSELSVRELIVEHNAYNPAKKLRSWGKKRDLLVTNILALASEKYNTLKPRDLKLTDTAHETRATPNDTTIGGMACLLLCRKDQTGLGMSYEHILKCLKTIVPDSDVSIASLRWYASKIKTGKLEGKLPEKRLRKRRTHKTKEGN